MVPADIPNGVRMVTIALPDYDAVALPINHLRHEAMETKHELSVEQ